MSLLLTNFKLFEQISYHLPAVHCFLVENALSVSQQDKQIFSTELFFSLLLWRQEKILVNPATFSSDKLSSWPKKVLVWLQYNYLDFSSKYANLYMFDLWALIFTSGWRVFSPSFLKVSHGWNDVVHEKALWKLSGSVELYD